MELSRRMRTLRTAPVPWSGDADEVSVVVTVPAFHAPVHYELDKALGVLRVTRVLRREPYLVHSCGFIPRTLAGDGRPVEVVVFAPWPLERLSLVAVRPVGMLVIRLDGIMQSWIIAVPADRICSTTSSIRTADDIGSAILSRLVLFLAGCSDNPPSGDFCIQWANARCAKDVIRHAACAFNEHGQSRRR